MNEQLQKPYSHCSDGGPVWHCMTRHSWIWGSRVALNHEAGDMCVLRLTRAAGYDDSLSFALHPDGSNHDWIYDTTEGKESLILWGTVNLTDIPVICALWIYSSMCKKLIEMTGLHRNNNNNNNNDDKNNKQNMTLP